MVSLVIPIRFEDVSVLFVDQYTYIWQSLPVRNFVRHGATTRRPLRLVWLFDRLLLRFKIFRHGVIFAARSVVKL